MAETIGIKIANGDFYPIMEENSTIKKRLVLTTVHDRQESVQIDLFRSVSRTMLDAQYIGSLVVENIKARPRGEPSIEMIISSGRNGAISADACDLDPGANGERHTLNVSHKTIDSIGSSAHSPDFDFENKRQSSGALYSNSETFKEEKRKSPWLIMIIATIFVVIVIALLWFFFLGGKDTLPLGDIISSFGTQQAQQTQQQPVPEPAVLPPPPPPPPSPEPFIIDEPEPLFIQAPVEAPPARPQTAERKRPPAPVSSYKVPAVIPKDGAPYRIRWGDTLWDISEAFYRDPWLYPRIARYNKIPNPDLIIAGRTIRVPPKN